MILATNTQRIATNFKTSLAEVAINSTSSSAARSAINGDSFIDNIKDQGKNILIYTIGKVAANEIGAAAHGATNQDGVFIDANGNKISYLGNDSPIGKATQLTLHAGLGCGIGAASGGGCMGAAVAGVVGEMVGDSLRNSVREGEILREGAISMAGLSGAISSSLVGNLAGVGDEENAKGIWVGAMVGGNAARENALYLVTGTDKNQKMSSSKEDLDPTFRKAVEETFGEQIIDFEWTGGNTKEARLDAAQKLDNMLESYQFTEGEKLNLVGFSHGGNVIKDFTQLYDGDKKIDNLVFLGTPHREDYNVKLDFSDLSIDANKVSVYSPQDGVQSRGYVDGSVYKGIITIPKEELRTISGFDNIRVNQGVFTSPIAAHINLKTMPVWNNNVRPNLNLNYDK